MSPEQAAGDREIDGRSDLYSLGIVAYQSLAGELPFRAPTVPGILMKQIMERAPLVTEKRPDCPVDLAAAVGRCLEKDPEDRWPTADALRRALEARSATVYRPVQRQPARPLPPPQAPRARDRGGRRALRRREREEERARTEASGEPRIVRESRASFVRWLSVTGALVVLDVVTGNQLGQLVLVVSGGMAAFSLVPKYVRLWHAGYSWRDVIARPAAPDAIAPRRASTALPAASAEEFGPYIEVVRQTRGDRAAILKIVDGLPASERKLLPDVLSTVDALLKRAEDLARVLHAMGAGVEGGVIDRIDEKISATERQAEGAERGRQLDLLHRQREALGELLNRRRQVEEQLESCGLAMQNVRFDLLRLRSAGVAAVLGDLTHATEQARALSRDVDHAIAAADDIREALGQAP
jgi:serine/threonine-protein kinase